MKKSVVDFIEDRKSHIKQNNPDTVFLIGGGKSLLQYLPDKSILNNQNVITSNDGFLLFPDALICHFADWCWFTWNREKLLKLCKDNITVANNHDFQRLENFYGDLGIVSFKYREHKGLNKNIQWVNGNNTGHHIINLAYHLGFKNLILVGYDLVEVSKNHWHNNHKRPTNLKSFSEVMIPNFNSLSDAKQQYNLNIVNLNFDSGLRCFEFGKIENFLK